MAATGVIGSLIFVGMEIDQNTRVAQAHARTELANANKEWLMAMATDPNIQEVWFTDWRNIDNSPEDLPEDVRRSVNMLLHHNYRNFENVYFQFKEGLVDEAALAAYGMGGPAFWPTFGSPFARSAWEQGKETYDSEFAAYYDELLENEPVNASER